MKIKPLKQVLAVAALALATLVPSAAFAGDGHRGHYKRHVVREYGYVYYPERQVYYAPHNHNWYWRDRGYWRSGAYLPRSYYGGSGVNIVLNVDRPYARHDYVVERYKARPPARHYREYSRYDRDDRYYRDDRSYRDRRWRDDD